MWNKNKKFANFIKTFRRIYKIFKNRILLESNFENSIILKPSLGSREIPQQIWARSVQPFWRLWDTNKQTDRQAKFIYRWSTFSFFNNGWFPGVFLLKLLWNRKNTIFLWSQTSEVWIRIIYVNVLDIIHQHDIRKKVNFPRCRLNHA